MKKLILHRTALGSLVLVSLMLGLAACSSEPDFNVPCQKNSESEPRDLTVIEAVTASAEREAARLFPDAATSRAGGMRADASRVGVIKAASSRADESDTLMYVVNFENEGGYAIVSARNTDEVLAVVDHGSYDPEEGTENPGLEYFLACAENYVKNTTPPVNSISGAGGEMYPSPKTVIDTLAYHHVDCKLGALSWGSVRLYGDFCPNRDAGCSAVALGQMIAYFRYGERRQETFYYNFSERDIDSEEIDWTEVIRHKRQSTYDPKIGDWTDHICYSHDKNAAHQTICRFLRQLGKDGKSKYNEIPTYTEMSDENAYQVILKYCPTDKYNNTGILGFDAKGIHSSINRGFLYMMGECATRNIRWHWLGTGYDMLKYEVKYYEWNTTTWKYELKSTTGPLYNLWTYMNWGNDGLDDGFYRDNVFYTQNLGTFANTKYVGVTWIL